VWKKSSTHKVLVSRNTPSNNFMPQTKILHNVRMVGGAWQTARQAAASATGRESPSREEAFMGAQNGSPWTDGRGTARLSHTAGVDGDR
jgi:hypothetical protein